jgi:3-deoxy-D-manno-octulosonate 8-phosphate phosphatase (KDO 8-P phosphatase)
MTGERTVAMDMSGAGPPQAANCTPLGGSAAASAASVGALSGAGPPQAANCTPPGGSATASAASVGALSGAGPPQAANSVGAHILARARRVRFLSCDVDGVLTDGRIYVDDQGHEFKAFSALDGVAMHRLARAGIVVAWITGSTAPAVIHRAQQLRIPHLVMDAQDKRAPWERLRSELGIAPEQCAHIGDDLADIPVLAVCGLGVTVPHAPPAVRAQAHYVTVRDGGSGAVRELADLILNAQGHGDGAGIAAAPPPVLAPSLR